MAALAVPAPAAYEGSEVGPATIGAVVTGTVTRRRRMHARLASGPSQISARGSYCQLLPAQYVRVLPHPRRLEKSRFRRATTAGRPATSIDAMATTTFSLIGGAWHPGLPVVVVRRRSDLGR